MKSHIHVVTVNLAIKVPDAILDSHAYAQSAVTDALNTAMRECSIIDYAFYSDEVDDLGLSVPGEDYKEGDAFKGRM